MADIIQKITDLRKAFELNGSEYILTNQVNNKTKVFTTVKLPISSLVEFYKKNIPNVIKDKVDVGDIEAYAAPVKAVDEIDGWLLCNGQEVSRKKYKDLDEKIGAIYGRTSTHFKLPDLRGKTIMGYCSASSTYNPNSINSSNNFGYWNSGELKFAQTGGTYSHILKIKELPYHSHTVLPHDHNYLDLTKYSDYLEALDIKTVGGMGSLKWGPNAKTVFWVSNGSQAFPPMNMLLLQSKSLSTEINNRIKNISYDIQYDTKTHTGKVNLENMGGDALHNNLQPYNVINYIIKY